MLHLIFRLLAYSTVVQSCGVGVHLTLLERSLPYMPDTVGDNHRYAQAGAFFPDAFYSCAGESEAAEYTHWPPFMKAAVDYWREKYGTKGEQQQQRPRTRLQKALGWFSPKPNSVASEDGERLKAFIYGMLTHQVSDVSWHSLGLQQGILQMLTHLEFGGDEGKAHTVLDVGGDMIMVRRLLNSGHDLSWLNGGTWNWPSDDIIEIFKRAGYKIGATSLGLCMIRGRAALEGEMGISRAAYINYARQSPTLFAHLEDYYLGGTTEMAMAIRHCVKNLDNWFENGTPKDAWSLCEVFEGRSKQPPPAYTPVGELAHIVSNHNVTVNAAEPPRAEISNPDPVILTTGMTESLFGGSVAFGDFLNEPCVAIGAPFETFKDSGQRSPKGAVYLMKQSQLSSSEVQSSKADMSSMSSSNDYKFNERFGAQICRIKILERDVMVVSRPGYSRLDFFLENQAVFHLDWSDATDSYGSSGVKIVGESLHAADLDDDGMQELMIGAPRSDHYPDQQRGRVYVVSGQALRQMLLVGIGREADDTVFDINDVVEYVLEPPQQLASYALFGSKLAVVGDGKSRAILVGSPGLRKVFGYDYMGKHIFTLEPGSEQENLDFGGAMLVAGYDDGRIAIGNSVEDVGSCMQCGSVYIYRYVNGEVLLDDNVQYGGNAFTRFGLTGVKLDDQLIIASPHAQGERGSMWRIQLNGSNIIETLVEEGPKPWSNGFGGSLDAVSKDNETWVVAGMPYYGFENNLLQGAAAVYRF